MYDFKLLRTRSLRSVTRITNFDGTESIADGLIDDLYVNLQSKTGQKQAKNRSKTGQNVNGRQPGSGQKRESDDRADAERHLMNEKDEQLPKLFP